MPPMRAGSEIDEELLHHIEERVDRLVEAGWTEEEARREAMRRFGDLGQWRSAVQAQDRKDAGWRWMTMGIDTLVQDVRYALRAAWSRPGFSAALVATLGLGIGATGAAFSVVDAVMLRPLPFEEPDRIVDARLRLPNAFTLPELMADQAATWIEEADFLQSAAYHARRAMVRTDGEDAEEVSVLAVSHELDDVLGVGSAIGRSFVEDDVTAGQGVAIVSWAYWQRHGADPGLLGRSIELDGTPWTVVGVLGRGVKFPVAGRADVWVPMGPDLTVGGRAFSQIGVVGRLADGLGVASAQERADALAAALQEELPHEMGWSVHLQAVGEWRANPDTRRALWVVAGAVALMFLIAVFNAVNLLTVRAHARDGEVAVRKALGASRTRVIRQVLAESVVLSLLAGGLATVLAWLCAEGVRRIAPNELTFAMVHDFGLEHRALIAIFVVATLTGLAVGLGPALRLASTRAQAGGAARDRGADRRAQRLRTTLVGTEIATSMVLLVGAGLLLRSFGSMMSADVGMDSDRVAFAEVRLGSASYGTPADRAVFADAVLDRMRRLPGVERAVVAQGAPPEGGGITFASGLQAEGAEAVEGELLIPFGYAPPGYLETLGATLAGGRAVRPEDAETDGVVIDRDLAARVFADSDPVGRRFRLSEDGTWYTVVGVVDELRFGGVDDRLGEGVILFPLDLAEPPQYLTFVVRATGRADELLPGIRTAVREVDDRLPLNTLVTGRQALGEAAVRPRFLVSLVSAMAVTALCLAAIGVYGVLSYAVRLRRREVGIRLALGAPQSAIRSTLVGWGLRVGLVGTGIGLVGALALDDLLASLLYEVGPGDPGTIITAALTMLAITVVACVVPARRATRVDPIDVLRVE